MTTGTILIRFVCREVDPVIATGWHMILGGLPLLGLSLWGESQQWQNYMYELQNKIKTQREKIKEADQKEEKFRKKQLETEMEMKVMYNVQQRLIIEY
jgi:hypothetical protein